MSETDTGGGEEAAAPSTFFDRVTERSRDAASMIPSHARDFGVPGLLVAMLGGYLLIQRRLDRGPLPMSRVRDELGGDADVHYDL